MGSQSFGEGSLDRPLVRFYFTAGCPQLGLSERPVAGCPIIEGEVPAFEEKDSKLLCMICGETVSTVEQLVTHWREEVEKRRGGGKAEDGLKIKGIPYAEVKPLQRMQPNDVKSHEQLLQEDGDLTQRNGTEDAKESEKFLEEVELKSENIEDHKSFDLSVVKMEDVEVKLLECNNCDYACNRPITLRKHKYSKHSVGSGLNNTFRCHECEYVCDKIDLFRMHKKDKHRMQIYKCQKCDFACNLGKTLRLHIGNNHKDMGRSLSCDECDYTCGMRATLRMHKVRKHSEVPAAKKEIEPIIQCNKCMYSGVQRRFEFHSRKHSDKILSCDNCDFKAKFVEMRTHRIKVHAERKYACNQCNFKGLTPSRLDRHIQGKHEKSVQVCDKCEYKTSYSENFKIHLKTHDPETWFQCEQCPVRTPTNHMLRNHRDKEHHEITESQYNCLSCNFIAPTKSKLYVHAKNHKEQKEPERQKCKACDFTHFNSHHLKRHFLARHTKTRFQCHYCPCNSHTSTNNNNSNKRKINNNNNKKKTGS